MHDPLRLDSLGEKNPQVPGGLGEDHAGETHSHYLMVDVHGFDGEGASS